MLWNVCVKSIFRMKTILLQRAETNEELIEPLHIMQAYEKLACFFTLKQHI